MQKYCASAEECTYGYSSGIYLFISIKNVLEALSYKHCTYVGALRLKNELGCRLGSNANTDVPLCLLPHPLGGA